MKKSILTLVLMLTAIAVGAQEFTVNGLSYKITSGDSVMVTSYSIDYGREVAIPSVVTFGQLTYKVTDIGDKAFNGIKITSVSIPSSVGYIGDQAFSGNESLKTVILEDGDNPITLNDYNYSTFDNYDARYTVYSGRNIERKFRPSESPFPQATSITWGPKVTVIGDGEAKSPFLRAAVINNSVKTIGASAFEGAGNNSDVDELLISMGLYVEEFGSSAFYNCLKLKDIYIPKVLKAIPDNCFNSTRISEVIIPASVSSVGDQAFSWNDCIKTITIEDSDEPISFNDYSYPTFDNYGARYTVYSGRNIERKFRPGESPFPQATTIIWGSMVTAIGDGEGRSQFLRNAVIGNSVRTIGVSAFEGAGNISDTDELLISMSPNVVEMGSAAFYTCYKLKTIVLPKVLKAIPDNCFNSTRIQDVVIPASVMSVGDQAFSWNDNIKTIRIEDSDMSISFNDYSYPTFDNGNNARYTVYQGRNIERKFRPSESPFLQAVSVAFGAQVTELGSGMYNCVNIKNIIVPWETPISINSNVFNSNLYRSANLYVPRKSLAAYNAAPVWKNFIFREEMEETKCYTPTATLEDGRLHFECETKDVTFHYKYTYPEGREGTGNDIGVGQTINLTLYATKAGLEDSDKAYYELEISGGGSIVGIRGDVNQDGEVNVGDMVVISNIMSGNE